MTNVDIVGEMFDALDSGDYDAARSYLAKNFKYSGATPEPIGPDEYVELMRALRRAMPDFAIHAIATWDDDADEVRGEARLGGTHLNALDLRFVPKVNATNRVVTLPTEYWTATVRNGEIVLMHSEVAPNGGLAGLMDQLGREDLASCLRTKGVDCRTIEESRPLATHTF